MTGSNHPPKLTWRPGMSGDGYRQRHLYANGMRTRYFIMSASVIAHRTFGCRHGLYGSGMHPAGCALMLAADDRYTPLKHRAEQMAMADLERMAA